MAIAAHGAGRRFVWEASVLPDGEGGIMIDSRLQYPLLLAVLAALLTLGLKVASYLATDSISVLSDAAESVINLLTAGTAIISIWYSSRPVDPSHTYGHEKIEYLSSGLVGMLILIAAVSIAYYAVYRLLLPEPLHQLDLGTGLSLVAAFINLGTSQVLLRVGRSTGSIVLEAEGQHLRTDAWTTAGVVAGLVLVWSARTLWGRDPLWLDPTIALLLAANIAWTAITLIRRTIDGLMDHALPADEQARARAAIEANLEAGMDYHAVRSRRAGSRRFVDFHLLVPGHLTVQRAHEVTGRIEEALRAALPGSEVTVHVEPIEERGSWEDSALVPLEQAARKEALQRERPPTGS
jgi:cation diffusion facilitator family transporter